VLYPTLCFLNSKLIQKLKNETNANPSYSDFAMNESIVSTQGGSAAANSIQSREKDRQESSA
jgi:hypothetical protein